MAKGFLHGNGASGGGLNFSVVGGTNEPQNPKENTIWINTDTPITFWAFTSFSNITWEMANGSVYITATTGGESGGYFNALKKNEILLKPVSVKQRVNGAWVRKNATIYQNGKWNGIENIIVPNTGTKWSTYNTTVQSGADSTYLILSPVQSPGGQAVSGATASTSFDVTGYNTLYIRGYHECNNWTGSALNWFFSITNAAGTYASRIAERTNMAANTNHTAMSFEKTIDISALSGVCTIYTEAQNWATEIAQHGVRIYECRLY